MKQDRSIISIRKALLAASVAAAAMQAVPAWAQDAAAPAPADARSDGDIIVTAQKREERLQDTPVPVTALNTADLANRNQTRLQDYFTQVPGLSLNAQGNGKTNIALRGIITANFSNPTVAITIDDVPYGATNATADGQLVQPDLDPSDLQRIEVLRGPQGTLYGASSLGGLIKYVTTDPSTDRVSGRLQGDISTVYKGEIGYGARGAINLPLSDTVALRASAFSRSTPGYVDNVQTGKDDVNTIDVVGGRLALLLRPTETLIVKFSALHQYTRGQGTARTTTDFYLTPTFGYLNQSYLPDSGRFRTRTTLLTANAELDLGGATLTSVTGYGRNSNNERSDYRSAGTPAELENNMRTRKFSQELRLASDGSRTLEWLIGGFYTKEKSTSLQNIVRVDAAGNAINAPAPSPYGSDIYTADFPTSYEEIAAFGYVTYHFTDRFNLQGGLRYSKNRQTIFERDSGEFAESVAPTVTADNVAKDDTLTFVVVPQFKFSQDLMAYLRLAKGYRPGGPNGSVTLSSGIPAAFTADTTMNYEIGMKGKVAEGLTFDVSAYYIDWNDVQVQIVQNGLSFFDNAGKAKSRGVEGSLQYRARWGLTIAANASYGVAEFAEDPPAFIPADKGTRLPFSPKFSGSFSVDQDIALNDQWTASFGGTLAHVGQRFGPLRPPVSRLNLPSYNTVDLRAGVRTLDWNISLFARNIANEHGVLSAGAEGSQAVTGVFGVNYVTPRTFGLSVARNF